MTDDPTAGRGTFRQMAREFPLRTGVFAVVLPLLGVLQLVNGYVHGAALPYAAGFALLVVAVSAYTTRCHLAAYRRRCLSEAWLNRE